MTEPFVPVRGLHHFAWRCRDCEETRAFYEDLLGLPLVHVIRSDVVPSTGEHCPYVHIFFRMADGSHLAFFDLGDDQVAQPSPNTPSWVNHIALRVDSVEALRAAKARLEAAGVEVLGITDHHIIESIYFFDPNGHRVELACPDPDEDNLLRRLDAVKWDMLEDWSRTKRAAHASCQRGSQLSQCDRDRRRPGLVLAVSRLFPVGRNDLERLAAGSGPAPRRGVQLCLGRRAHASRHFS